MNNRIRALMRKEFLQMIRDRPALAMMVLIPVVWLVAFGYAVTFDVKAIPTAIIDHSGTTAGHNLAADFRQSTYFSVVSSTASNPAQLREEIRNGHIIVGLYIPLGYAATPADTSIHQVRPAQAATAPLLLADGSDLFSTQAALRTAQIIFARDALQGLTHNLHAVAGSVGPLVPAIAQPQIQVLYNETLQSSAVMIPGLIGLVMVFIATLMTALGVVRERERGTLEQLIVTPIRPLELMLGKVLPYVLVSAADFIVVLIAGLLLFNVPLRGNLLLLALTSAFFLLGALAIGLLISTVSQNQQQAMQLAIFTLLPQFIFSGFIFPLTAMPWGVRWLSYLVPLTYFMPVARGVFLKAEGFAALWQNVLILGLYGILVLAFAALRFQKRLA